MGDLSFARCFRLRPGGVECDAGGLRVGDVALLARDANGGWAKRSQGDLSRELSKLYGVTLDFGSKRRGVEAVAAALTNGEIARAQIAALLLQLPDPQGSTSAQSDDLEKRRLVRDLVACGLLKADADWNDKHPRTGAPSRSGDTLAFVPPAPAAPSPGWSAVPIGDRLWSRRSTPSTARSPICAARTESRPPRRSPTTVNPGSAPNRRKSRRRRHRPTRSPTRNTSADCVTRWRSGSAACSSTAAIRLRGFCSKPRRTSTSCSMRTTSCTGGLIRKGPSNSNAKPSESGARRWPRGRLACANREGYRGLKKTWDRLPLPVRSVVTVVYDPD